MLHYIIVLLFATTTIAYQCFVNISLFVYDLCYEKRTHREYSFTQKQVWNTSEKPPIVKQAVI